MNPQQWDGLHGGRLTEMLQVADLAGRHTLQYFRDDLLKVESKSDRSPVTVADREAEELVRQRLAESFPDDAVIGEEMPNTGGRTEYRWIVDPIDGTKSFICGVPLYSTLLALQHEDRCVAGMIFMPALQQAVVAANEHGAWYRHKSDHWSPATVRDRDGLDGSVLLLSQRDTFADRDAEAALKRLESRCAITRTWGDGYGYFLVATGRADIMIDAECNAWDVAAIEPIVREAGGVFTDWKGDARIDGGDGVGTGGKIHAEVLSILGDAPD